MDLKLLEASHAGDLPALHQLLQEDRLLLDRPTTNPTDSPLHIAAVLGHANFAREIMRMKPGLARDLNTHGLSPMHLASASGNLPVVRELLNEGGSELCLVRDKDGLMPIHAAASKGGRVHVLRELMEACPQSARELTYSRDTVLHLAVKSYCFETAQFLVDKIDSEELFNSKDDKGNTVLHLATVRRQLQITKLLLAKPGIDVNVLNSRNLTVLDTLLDLPSEQGDLTLGETIRAAGGKTTGEGERKDEGEGEGEVESHQAAEQPTSPVTADSPPTRPQSNSLWMQVAVWFGLLHLHTNRDRPQPDPEVSNIQGTLIVVATLIATITFQSGLSPPGGFDSQTGMSVLGKKLLFFLIPDMVGLFASLSVILLYICVVPRGTRKLTKTLLWVMWLAVFSTALAFSAAAYQIFPDSGLVVFLLQGWFIILALTVLWVYLRLVVYLMLMVGWWKKPGDGGNNIAQMGRNLVVRKAFIVVMVIATPVAVNFTARVTFGSPGVIWILVFYYACWLILSSPTYWIYLKFVKYMLRMVGWWKNREGDEESNAPCGMGIALVYKRILVVIMIFATSLVGIIIIPCSIIIPAAYHWGSLF